MPHVLTHRPRALLMAGALLLTGCGLSDYTGEMSSEASRVRAWDEETRLLGPLVKMPELPKKDGKEQEWIVFLRPPLGVSDAPTTPKNSTQAQLFGPLVQYAGASNTASGVLNVYLGVAVDSKDFVNSVFTQFSVPPGGDYVKVPRSVILLSSTGRALPEEITVKRRTAEVQQYAYSFNFYEHDKTQVAVVYQMEKGNTKAEAAIKASLATLGEGEEVLRMKTVYGKTNHPVKK